MGDKKKKRIYRWAKRLPKPSYKYTYSPEDSFSRTPMQGGRARHRAGNELENMKINVEWKVPYEDMDDFLFFVHKIIGEDSGWDFFEIPLIFGNEIKYTQARFCEGNKPYNSVNESNVQWSVTAKLEVIGLDFMKESDFFERNPDVFETAIEPLDKLVNEDMPAYFKGK